MLSFRPFQHVVFVTLLSLLANWTAAQEIGFIEDFALAEDRAKALEQLVPGTQEYYYYNCLHFQNTEQLDKVDDLIVKWIKRYGNTEQVRKIKNRQALLNFNNNPAKTYSHLQNELNLRFNHQRQIPQAQRDLATELNQSLFSTQTLLDRALARQRNTQQIEMSGLPLIANLKLDKTRRRHLLQRLRHPSFPNLVELISQDLRERDSGGFGSMPIHRQLTLAQLDKALAKTPKLRDNSNYINTYLKKLHPSADINWAANAVEKRKYLDRLWAFVDTLSPSHNSLKASVLYRLLELDRSENKFHRSRFMAYLKLPRSIGYVNPKLVEALRSRNQIANLSVSFQQTTRLLPIHTDEHLVNSYLHYFLKDANDYGEFLPYIRDTYLKRQFATVKILNGLGDVERWASMLSPTQYQNILDRVDLDFALTNSEFFGDDESVAVDLYTKNIDKMIVKVFEINTFNYYRKNRREIDTNISLDGLVPNFEESFEYSEAPALRKKRTYTFDNITKPGVYIIDFIAGGTSSRALIRRGRMTLATQPTIAGQQLRVFDHNREVVPNAQVWIANRKYTPDKDGFIVVPFSNQPSRQAAIISQGNLSSLQMINQMSENYSCTASMYVDRESLTRNNETNLVIRPRLTVSGIPTSVSLLKNTKLAVTTVSLDGISTTKNYDSIELSDTELTKVKFIVPPRLKSISFSLTSQVENVSRNKLETMNASTTYQINQIDTTDSIQDIHLLPTADGYWLEVRGKTGELRAKQPVRIAVKHQLFKEQITINLQSDRNGLIALGSLENISFLRANVAGGLEHQWALFDNHETNHRSIHMAQGETIQIVAPHGLENATPDRLSLIERRNGEFTHDRFEHVSLANGIIRITKLDAGDYQLRVAPSGLSYNIRIADGPMSENVVLGQSRHLEIRNPRPMAIAQVESNDDKLTINLSNAKPNTRIHVIASRFKPAFDAYHSFQQVKDIEPWQFRPSVRKSVYLAGRTIGDEFQYILDRKYAKKFSGNMLDRPSLLLAPWDSRETKNNVEQLAKGDRFGESGTEDDEAADRDDAKSAQAVRNIDQTNLDFLAAQSTTLWNLKPDENGVVTIDIEKLAEHQHVRILAVDHDGVSQRSINLEPMNSKVRDMRLAHVMSPEGHFCQSKQTETLSQGQSLTIDDLVSAKFQYFDELSDVYRLYTALNPSTKLGEFKFILDWSTKTDAQKRELYSKFACHELNFYLYKKDQPFFDSVIKSHLENKRHLQFMDKWLLGRNLTTYISPWRYAKLNVVERVLLAQRMEDRAVDIARSLDDLYLTKPTSRTQFSHFYDTSINFDALGWSRPQGKTLEGKPALPQLAGGGGGLGGGGGGGRGRASRKSKGIALGGVRGAMDSSFKQGMIAANAVPPSASFEVEALDELKMEEIKAVKRVRQEMNRMAQKELLGLDKSIKLRYDSRANLGTTVERLGRLRSQQSALYRRLPATKEWLENNYYRLLPEQVTPDLVGTNRYWRDYAHHRGGTFLSKYFSEANRTMTEMLMALAVMDLPEKAGDHDFKYVDNSMTLTAASPVIALHQQVRPVEFEPGNTTILVSENFFIKNDRYRHQDGVRYDKFIDGEFLAHTLYGGQVVITNPTSTPNEIDLLVQIPQGSVIASGSQATRTRQLNLNAFSTLTFEYYFYFPTAGEFTHYPAHVSSDESVLAVAPNVEFTVVDRPAELDKSSWEFVSQNGSEDEVIEFLMQQNLLRFDLSKIAFRMKQKAFFERVVEVLKDRFIYNHVLWSYAIKHHIDSSANEYLEHDNLAIRLGPYFKSPLLKVTPTERNWYYHREYAPLVNARTHQVGTKRKILNPAFHSQYHSLLNILSNRPALTDEDNLVMTYYMLLQDRIDEALQHFSKVNSEQLECQLQYDYCSAYLDMYLEKPDSAAAKASKWADYPVDLWRKRFGNILAQVDEIRGGSASVVDNRNNTQQQTQMASKEQSFEFKVESGKVIIDGQNLAGITANYYEMDIELLFSRSPFEQDNFDGFSFIHPNLSQNLQLDSGKPKHEFEIPNEFQNKNVLVEISAGDQVKSKPYFANSLSVQVLENYGQIRVTRESNAISKTYVKVYAQSHDGKVRFHKDGYTDLRGRFDYVTQSNNSLDDVKKYSILILSPEYGAVIRQVAPPAE